MDSPIHSKACTASFGRRAFTLIELLVVVAIVVMMVGLLLPALAGTRTKSKSAQCLNNSRQLSLAWLMYAGDNHDYFLCSSDDGKNTNPYQTTVGGGKLGNQVDNYAWTWSKLDFTAGNPYNYDVAADIMLRPMWNYNRNASIYRCPADISVAISNSVSVPRVRSYSMNWFLGGFGENASDASASGTAFKFYTKLTALNDLTTAPGAATTFLFIEERSDTITWGNFQTDMAGYPQPGKVAVPAAYQWVEDMPAFYHNFTSVISFTDGHSELHRWQGDAGDTLPAAQGLVFGGHGNEGQNWPVPYSPDVAWMQNVTTRAH